LIAPVVVSTSYTGHCRYSARDRQYE